VAGLARSFNRAADQIEQLVTAQRRQLAFASHELRSAPRPAPGVARASGRRRGRQGPGGARRRGAGRAPLRAARGEPARGSRETRRDEPVDLLGLVAEEAARAEAAAEGEPVVVRGDPRLLRRLVRNLLENARRHGGGAGVEARVQASAPARA